MRRLLVKFAAEAPDGIRDTARSCLVRYPCHNGHVNQPQKFTFIANPGWIQNPITWGDNGRRRTFETCLDRLPTQQQNIAVLDCADTRSSGVRWDALGIWRGRCITAMDIAKHAVEFQPVLAVTTSRNGRESWHRRSTGCC